MNNRIDAIYARQSVDKKDSISIESQIEFCKYELKGGNCKEYTDKGYSGKNTDRPKFQELVRDIKRGLIAKVVVYKLDRISRSILDFAEQGILFNGKELIRPTLAQMLRNPVYVQAGLDVYEFFKSQGTIIVNDAADFTGMNGCYLYQGRDVKPSKKNDLKLRKSWYHSESVMFIIINGLESVTLS